MKPIIKISILTVTIILAIASISLVSAKKTSYRSIIGENKISSLSYDLLKEVVPNTNKIAKKKINIIFDCRSMNQADFDYALCLSKLPLLLKTGTKLTPDENGDYQKPDMGGYGFLEVEPYKSNKKLFNFWYLDRNAFPSGLSAATMNTCDLRDTSIVYSEDIPNIFTVNVCYNPLNDERNGYGARFKIPGVTHDSSFDDDQGQLQQLGIKGHFRFGVQNLNGPLDVHTFVHEGAHAFGGLIDEYSLSANTGAVITKGGGIPDNGWPNCAPDAATAGRWWKETGLIPKNAAYFPGCWDKQYLITDEKSMMNKTQDFNPNRIFSAVQKYWLCRNMYSLTGKAYGSCQTLKKKFGFDHPLYGP